MKMKIGPKIGWTRNMAKCVLFIFFFPLIIQWSWKLAHSLQIGWSISIYLLNLIKIAHWGSMIQTSNHPMTYDQSSPNPMTRIAHLMSNDQKSPMINDHSSLDLWSMITHLMINDHPNWLIALSIWLIIVPSASFAGPSALLPGHRLLLALPGSAFHRIFPHVQLPVVPPFALLGLCESICLAHRATVACQRGACPR